MFKCVTLKRVKILYLYFLISNIKFIIILKANNLNIYFHKIFHNIKNTQKLIIHA